MAARVSSPDLVGRTGELADLEHALEQASAGEAGIVLVSGDAGVGKSRLVAELAARAEAARARTLVGECVELSEGEIPFAPIVSALRRLARAIDEDDFAQILGPAREELTRLFPELAPSSERPPELLSLGSVGQSRLFELLLGVLERLGADAPVLLVIEDLHWADASTRDLLQFLGRSIRQERLLIVVTYRSDELHRRHPLRPFLVQIERLPAVTRVELAPLSRDEVASQIECILGERPAALIADEIYERSEGNPFFAEELLAARSGAGGLPGTLRDALLLRVEALSDASQQILRVVAAAGRAAQHRLLAEVLDLPESELLAGLREAVGAHVLVEAADEASYEFRHALMREAIYDDLLPGERGQLHVALAQALEHDPELAGQGTSVAAELAFHWYAAHELGCALRASVEAGLEADRMYAFTEADRHYERALELWERVPADADRGIEYAELLSRAAEAAHHGGRDDRAAALIRTLLDQLDPADPKPVARVLVRLGRYLWVGGRGVESVGVYHRAVGVLPPEPSTERAHALAGEAQVLMLSDRSREASALCNEALAVARAVGDRRVEANILNTQVACATFDADVDAAMDWMRSAQAIAGELGQPDELMRAYVNGSDCLHQVGRVEEALNLALDGAEHARSIGLERHSGHFLQAEAAARMMCLGRWQEAGELSRAVIEGSMAPLALIIAREVEAVIAALRGEFEQARKPVDESRATALLAGSSMWIPLQAYPHALLEVAEGRPEQARAAITDAFAHMEGEYVFFTRHLYSTGARAEADIAERARPLRDDAVVRDCESRAAALVERIDGLLALYADYPPPPAAVAARALAAAELSRARGASDPVLWQDAANAEDGIGQVHGGAYARFREAEAIVRRDGPGSDAARTALEKARTAAAALGMRPLLEEIDGLARRARLKLAEGSSAETPVQAEAGVAADLGLTNRELEVLVLVAEGLTNKQIGEHLFMSDKTASVHVSRILVKLGAANRTEAAASAQRLGLAGSR